MPKGSNPNSLKALEQNRKKIFQDTAKAVEAGKKGGKALRENNAKRRTMREELEILLQGTIDQKDKNGKVAATMTRQEAVNIAIIQKALKGDTRAYEIIRDTIGENPTLDIKLTDVPVINIDL